MNKLDADIAQKEERMRSLNHHVSYFVNTTRKTDMLEVAIVVEERETLQ